MNINSFLIEPFFYNWLILGGILLIIEVSTFSLLFLWVSIAAITTAIFSFIFPEMTITLQLWIFSILILLSIIIWSKIFRKQQKKNCSQKLNNRASRYIGRVSILSEAIINGRGKIKIEDSIWIVRCKKDMPVGSNVKIIGTEGTILVVEDVRV